MGRIFITGGQSSLRSDPLELNLTASGVMEAQEVSAVRELVVQILRSRNYELLPVSPDLTLEQAIDWINARCQRGDVALQLAADALDRTTRGAIVFYIAHNEQRKTQAEQLLQAYLRRVPHLSSRGTKSDAQTALGQLAFCRQVIVPSLQITLGSLIDLDDRHLLQTQRQEVALGIAEGLAAWSYAIAPDRATLLPVSYPAIDLSVNGATCEDKGALIEGNAYIPVDLLDLLGVDLPVDSTVQRISYRNVVFVRAIDLPAGNLSIRLQEHNQAQTLVLRTGSPTNLEQIMGQGQISDVQMMVFLKSHYADGLTRFPELPKLYREEASIERVNSDIAFAQMCVETEFLRFSKTVKPEQNNFAGLGAIQSGLEGASFSTPRIGVRAQIQHLKAYASSEPLVQAIVDPRFHTIRRGIAPSLQQLNGRWTNDRQYHQRILSVLRRLYESAGFL